jgi:hypothetical protein
MLDVDDLPELLFCCEKQQPNKKKTQTKKLDKKTTKLKKK